MTATHECKGLIVIINIPCSKYFLFKFYEQYSFIFGQYNVNFNYFSNQKIRQTSCFLLDISLFNNIKISNTKVFISIFGK